MKEKIGFLIISVLLSATLSLGAVAIAQQNDWFPSSQKINNWDEGDSIKVAQIYEQLESPKLYTVKDVLDLQEQTIQQTTDRELFISLPANVIKSVSGVLLNTDRFVTEKSLINEYRANAAVYNNLPVNYNSPTDIKDSVDLGATDLSSRQDRTISSHFSRRTDTVNGKPVNIVTETTERYE